MEGEYIMIYVHKNNFNVSLTNIYCVKSILSHRGHSSLSLIINNDKPPIKWFESPKKSGEIIIAIADIHVEGPYIKFDKYISTLHPSSIYNKPINIKEILDDPHIKWID